MLKAPKNPNCRNDFENIEIEFCPQLQITHEAFYALTEKEIMKIYFWLQTIWEKLYPNCKCYKN